MIDKILNFFKNLLVDARNFKFGSVLVRLLKLYGVFAVLHVFGKVYFSIYRVSRARKLWRHLPGGKFDTFGADLAKNAFRFHGYYRDQALKYPTSPLVKTKAPFLELICNTPESIQWMLKDEFVNVTKPSGNLDYLFYMMGEFIGDDGIFVLRHGHVKSDKKLTDENDKWFKERKVASRIFTKANFEGFMYNTFVEKGEIMIKKLTEVSAKKEKVDMQELFFSFTMDSIEKLFFGNDVNTVAGGMSTYGKAFDEAHKNMLSFIQGTVFMQIANKILFPYPFGKLTHSGDEHWLISTQLVRYFSPVIKPFKAAIKTLDDHVYEYISKTRNDPKLTERTDIVANFLNSNFGSELSDKILRDIILNLTIAGRDTTACALSWLFFELSQNQDVQQKLFEELNLKLNGRTPTIEELEPANLPYLNGCLYEALRLHPPVPTEVKITTKDLTYLDGTIIPEGTRLMYLPFAVGRNPVSFPNPMKFDPERWIPFAEKQKTLFEFPVFQAGPRFCLGKDMAQFEAKLLSAMLLQKFKFDLLEGEEKKIWYTMSLTMAVCNCPERKTNNLWMFPRFRK